VILHDLHPSEYEHPTDRVTLEVLRQIPLVPKLLELINIPQSMIRRTELLGSNLRVNERQLPSVYKMMRQACEVMEVDEPLLYVSSAPELNAFTTCPDKPIVCIHGDLLDAMEHNEIMFVIGHELAHIKSQHIIYKMLGGILAENILNTVLSTVPGLATFSGAAVIALNYAYFEWSRAAEFSCDRGGYLACQDFGASCKALMKLAGASKRYINELNLKEFIAQARDFKDMDSSALGVIQKVILSYGRSHPWSVSRVNELINFYQTGGYNDVLHRKTLRDPAEIAAMPETAYTTTPSIADSATEAFDKASIIAKGAVTGLTKSLKKLAEKSDDSRTDEN